METSECVKYNVNVPLFYVVLCLPKVVHRSNMILDGLQCQYAAICNVKPSKNAVFNIMRMSNMSR